MLSVANMPMMLSVSMLSDIMLSVVMLIVIALTQSRILKYKRIDQIV
jgi:hypothetical protein